MLGLARQKTNRIERIASMQRGMENQSEYIYLCMQTILLAAEHSGSSMQLAFACFLVCACVCACVEMYGDESVSNNNMLFENIDL